MLCVSSGVVWSWVVVFVSLSNTRNMVNGKKMMLSWWGGFCGLGKQCIGDLSK